MSDTTEGATVAADSDSCPKCALENEPGSHFCENCGYDLVGGHAPAAEAETPAAESAPVLCATCGVDDFDDEGYCRGCGQARPVSDRSEIDLGRIAAVTDRGKHHDRNEDGVAIHLDDVARHAILVVSDGVSSSDDSDQASRAACDSAVAVFAEQLAAGVDTVTATNAAVAAAAAAVAALGEGHPGDRAPACTFVSAVITADSVTIGWLGDSRAYWLAGGLEDASENHTIALSQCLTLDDSWATQMVAAGLLEYEEAAADPRAHALTAWLGADADPEAIIPHTRRFIPSAPGAVLVCTDGLWNYFDAAELLTVHAIPTALSSPITAAHLLADLALEAGGHDNITIAIAPFPMPTPDGHT